MRWTRANKIDLARQISSLMAEKLSYRQIAERVGKSKTRVFQIVQLFSLQGRTIVR